MLRWILACCESQGQISSENITARVEMSTIREKPQEVVPRLNRHNAACPNRQRLTEDCFQHDSQRASKQRATENAVNVLGESNKGDCRKR